MALSAPAFSPPTCSASGSFAFSRTSVTHASTLAAAIARGSSVRMRSCRICIHGDGPVKSNSPVGKARSVPWAAPLTPVLVRKANAASHVRSGINTVMTRWDLAGG